jgi:hypothetical protein
VLSGARNSCRSFAPVTLTIGYGRESRSISPDLRRYPMNDKNIAADNDLEGRNIHISPVEIFAFYRLDRSGLRL